MDSWHLSVPNSFEQLLDEVRRVDWSWASLSSTRELHAPWLHPASFGVADANDSFMDPQA